MKQSLFSLFIFLTLASCSGADVPLLMEKYLWQKRVLLVFAPTTADPLLTKQVNITDSAISGMKKRDLVRFVIVHNTHIFVDEEQKPYLGTPPFYEHYNVTPEEFTVILLGKDGEEKLRKSEPISAQKLFAVIDAMPMRQEEVGKPKN